MGNNVFLTTILVFLLVADVSNAAFLRNLQKLAASPPIEDPNKPGAPIPIPSPVLPGNQSRSVGGEEKGKENKQIGPPPATKAGKDASKDKQVTNDMDTIHATPPTEAKKDNNTHKETVKDKEKEEEKKEEEKEKKEEKEEDKKENEEEKKENGEEKKEDKSKQKEESKPIVPVGSDESCDEIGRRCQDLKSMTACVKSFDDSKALVLIQNKGNIDLKVDVSAMSSGSKHNTITVPKLQSNQVKMSLADGGINEIILNAGNGNCVLHLSTPVSQGNYFQILPSYSKFITPTYGAYLVLVITLIAGGVLGCCWFSKRKGQRDIPYQELELSMPESAVAAETAEGWDEVWDDDWDEENAVRSPGGHRISANGLTARNSKKDDWEDWDD